MQNLRSNEIIPVVQRPEPFSAGVVGAVVFFRNNRLRFDDHPFNHAKSFPDCESFPYENNESENES